ncbi:unnamed protein product [Heligmosomoides polygyrus]|uniref:Ground-like domain-containing protein n=1 Tax=Heligmosomoides polygyrus TaxID=6339 RepID=A0A3P7YZA4_HELPZ|nr:unnamed protein product [Heligmosomoides polygyrus]
MVHTSAVAAICVLSLFASCHAQADNCYINDSGSVNWNPCLIQDLLSAADEIQKMAETTLGGKFETVVALDDFAYKSHFKEGKTCKIEKNGQYALAWQP